MKKRILLLCIFLFAFAFKMVAGERDLKYVPKEYLGTYLAVDYIDLLKKYNNHQKALMEIAKTHYNVLCLNESKCYSTELFGDGYAILASKFDKWVFKSIENEKFIIDENNYLYKRISEETIEDSACEFILKYIFGLYPEVHFPITGDSVRIANITYKIEMHPNFPLNNSSEYAIMLYVIDTEDFVPEKKFYFVFLEKNGFKIVKGINEDDMWHIYPTEEIVYSYLR